MTDQPFPALRYLLSHASERGLFPEERLELQQAIGVLTRLAMPCVCKTDDGELCVHHGEKVTARREGGGK